ncbi:hypothetical protein [Enterovibrio calviensis]|uniref:hypothetical protein n=1 Tax=Enterovibrio calviensis TaxID=91359 RepID=UPI000481EC6C|nr:hypothetical protein [Enterovibrio calviensis]
MVLGDFFDALLAFPTNVFFLPFLLFLLILLIDLVFNVVEGVTGDLDLFDLDNIPGSGLLLPPVLSKVPLMVALSVSFFVATVISFYLTMYISVLFPSTIQFVVDLVSIPIIAYLSLAISAWLLKPISPLFDRKKAFAEVEFIGLKGRVHSSVVTQDKGEIMVLHQGNEFLLDVVIQDDVSTSYGDEVIIVYKDSATKRYVVAKA